MRPLGLALLHDGRATVEPVKARLTGRPLPVAAALRERRADADPAALGITP